MRFWETEHVHGFPWEQVAAGYWTRYPNEHSSHVFSVDTLETKVVDGKLYCRRLIIKTNPLPSWGKHFFNARRVPVIEECLIDPAQKQLTWYVRNIGLGAFMATVEKARLHPSPTDPWTTLINKQVWIDSSIVGFRSAIRKFGIDRYKKNCILATEGFETVLKEKYGQSTLASAGQSTLASAGQSTLASAGPSDRRPAETPGIKPEINHAAMAPVSLQDMKMKFAHKMG